MQQPGGANECPKMGPELSSCQKAFTNGYLTHDARRGGKGGTGGPNQRSLPS